MNLSAAERGLKSGGVSNSTANEPLLKLHKGATFFQKRGLNRYMTQYDEMTLSGLCREASEKYNDRIAFAMLREGRVCSQVTYRSLGVRARQIAALLGRLGVKAGDRVLILSENRPEWPLAYFGIALAGAVSVPVLTGFSAEQIQHICDHAGVQAICVSRTLAEKIKAPAAPLIFIDSITGAVPENADTINIALNGVEKKLPLPDPGEGRQFSGRTAEDLASIVYTSGTAGNSKGVMLSNRNLISCVRASISLVKIYPRDRLLSALPLAHAYECALGLLAPVTSGAMIAYLDRPPSPSALLPAAQALKPTAMVSVPLLIEKIYQNAIAPKLKKSALYRCALTRPLAILLAGKKLSAALGGSLRFFGIGGAPLAPETENFLRKARFPFAPGYGLTEASPLVAGTAPYRFRPRSAGALPKGIEARVSREGELQIRGPNVMMGYYRDAEKTAEAFTGDGWLRSGDIGSIDKKGRVFVKGRLKALILGPSGENIYPEEIEGILSASGLVEDALVLPGEKGELVALVHISETAKAAILSAANALEKTIEDLRRWANKKLAVFSRLSRIDVREEPFEKTPTQKIKRYLYTKRNGNGSSEPLKT